LLLLQGAAQAAQEPPMTELEESLGRRKVAPVVPAELRPMVREATRDRLVVRSLAGADIVIDISEMEPERFVAFADGRYFGFSFIGYEYYGFLLIDRAMAGEEAVIATGEPPVFAADGGHFAAVQTSGAAFGNLEGLGIWEVRPGRTVQIFVTDVLPEGEEWRIDGWPRDDCVSVSWRERPPGSAELSADRRHFGIDIGEPIAIRASDNFPGCNVTDATGND
jgi:hypothetical protein